jgi:hypothetical protein
MKQQANLEIIMTRDVDASVLVGRQPLPTYLKYMTIDSKYNYLRMCYKKYI